MPLRGAPFQINFGADLRGLRRGLRNASHDLRRFNTDIERIGLSGAAKLRQYVARHSRQIVAGVGIAVGTAAAAATAATVATLNSADEAQKSFQRSTGATGAQAEGQWSAVLRTLRQVPDAIGVVATAQGKLRSSVAGSELGISDLTVRLLDFVRIAGGDSAEAASSYGRALNVFSLNAAEGAAKLDTLVAVTQDFEIDGGKLLALLQTFGPVLTTVGLDFEEAAIFIGQLHQGGVDLTRIAPGINAFGRRAAAAGHDIGEAFAFAVDQIAGAANQTEALDIAQGFFGAEGANRLTSAIRSGALDLNAAGEFVDAAAGRLAEQVDGTATASDRIAETWNAIQSAMIEELLPEFQATLAHIETIAPDLARIAGQFGRGAAAVLDLGLGGTVDSLLREVLTLGRGTTPLDESTSTQYAAAEALAAVLREDDRARTAGITDPDTLAQIRSLAEEVGALTAFASDPAGFAGYYGQQDFNRDFPTTSPRTSPRSPPMPPTPANARSTSSSTKPKPAETPDSPSSNSSPPRTPSPPASTATRSPPKPSPTEPKPSPKPRTTSSQQSTDTPSPAEPATSSSPNPSNSSTASAAACSPSNSNKPAAEAAAAAQPETPTHSPSKPAHPNSSSPARTPPSS